MLNFMLEPFSSRCGPCDVKVQVTVIWLYIYVYSSNKRRDREARGESSSFMKIKAGVAATEELEREAIKKGMLDATEIDNRGIRCLMRSPG